MRSIIAALGLLVLVLFLPSVTLAEHAPSFGASATSGVAYSSESLKGKIVVLEWFNRGCPFVHRLYESGDMQALQREFTGKGVVWLTVNSTNASHGDYISPGDVAGALEELKAQPTGYIVDSEGSLGRTFGAKSTPTIVMIDQQGEIAYSGAPDNYPEAKNDRSKLVNYARHALEAVVDGKHPNPSQTNAYGCSIKYAR